MSVLDASISKHDGNLVAKEITPEARNEVKIISCGRFKTTFYIKLLENCATNEFIFLDEYFKKFQIENKYAIIFICGIIWISDLHRFAEFSMRASDPNKKNFASNLMEDFHKNIVVSMWDLRKWHRLHGRKHIFNYFGGLS